MAGGHGIHNFSFPVCPDTGNAPSVLVHIFTRAIHSVRRFPAEPPVSRQAPLSSRFDVLSSPFLAPNPNRNCGASATQTGKSVVPSALTCPSRAGAFTEVQQCPICNSKLHHAHERHESLTQQVNISFRPTSSSFVYFASFAVSTEEFTLSGSVVRQNATLAEPTTKKPRITDVGVDSENAAAGSFRFRDASGSAIVSGKIDE
jgi:hypothetical protein